MTLKDGEIGYLILENYGFFLIEFGRKNYFFINNPVFQESVQLGGISRVSKKFDKKWENVTIKGVAITG